MIFIIFILLFFTRIGEASDPKLSYEGYLRNEIAYRYVGMKSLTKVRDVLKFQSKYKLNPNFNIVGTMKFSYDHVYDIADPNKVNPRKDLRELDIPRIQDPDAISPAGNELIFGVPAEAKKELEMKDLYIDGSFDDIDIRIGKQLVFWGVFDGFRITDEINPINFREFILRDVEDLRIPLWMGKFDYYYKNSNVELLWIPDLKFNESALNGSEFEFFRNFPGDDLPDRRVINNEWGIKIGGIINSVEWNMSTFSSYDDFPAAFRILKTDAVCENQATLPTTTFFPRHPRLTISGGSFRGILGKFVIRGEGAYISGKYFGMDPGVKNCDDINNFRSVIIEFNKSLGEVQRNFVRGGLGTDFSIQGADIAIQMWQQFILNYDQRIMEDEYQWSFSLFIRRPFNEDRYTPEVLVLYLVNGAQFLYRPKLSYRYNDDLRINLGMDIFSGKKGDSSQPGHLNFIGQFNDRDRVYMEMQHNF